MIHCTVVMYAIMFLAQCLCTITEDNPAAAILLANTKESLKILEKNLLCSETSEEIFLLKVHMAGNFNILYFLKSLCKVEFLGLAQIFLGSLKGDIKRL